ncbi:hypothetical protein [Ruminococcus sp. HUN007]|uniref:hypothetical protein n=1 Tax=Ruminococcus sp. HUN007 TaxID=1514668 RepID=UPI0005D1ED0D|nr:hypothetical protein [Ruminococcus sp. HUN007]
MKKNAILALIMAASMTATITSCGKSGEEVSSKPAQEVSNGTEQSSYNDAMGIEKTITETEAITEAEVEEEAVIEPTQEILAADIDSWKIQIGNKVYTLPVTLQTLLDDGAVILDNTNPISDVIGAHSGGGVIFSMDDKEYDLYFENYSEDRKQIKDCYAYLTYINKSENFIFPKGIRVGVTVADLKNAWGEPTEDNLDELRYIEYYKRVGESTTHQKYRYDVEIDLEQQTITGISFHLNLDYAMGDVANFVDVTESE